MRRSGVPLPPESIWLGESWEEPPPRARRPPLSRAVTALAERPVPATEDPAAFEAPRATIEPPPPVLEGPPAAIEPRPAPERRTVTIRGRGAERDLTWSAPRSRRRPAQPVHHRPGFKPDRAAMWAVLLGLLLVLVAATSSHAAVPAHLAHSAASLIAHR
jgi:hypothetical protein